MEHSAGLPSCPVDFGDWSILELTGFRTDGNIVIWDRLNDQLAPLCGELLIPALPPGGKGQRTFQCFDCDGPDPLKTERVTGWLKSELQPPK